MTAPAGRPGAWRLAAPALVWLAAFVAVPMLLVLAASVLSRGTYGGVRFSPSLDAYARVLEPLYLGILGRTVLVAAGTTLLCLVLGYPMAYAVARSGRWRRLLLFLVVAPLWTSALVRTYAILFLAREGGPLNALLLATGLSDEPLAMLYTPGAVLAGLAAGALPFMVLPIYVSLEKLDGALLEAASSLGARPWTRFVRVTLPLTMPGVVAGSLLVFVPTLGAFLVPDLLGGAKALLLGTLVQNQFGPARDWPFGAALATVAMAAVAGAAALGLRLRARIAGGTDA